MGWFDEQVRIRKKKDEELYERSFDNIASKVLGERRGLNDVRAALKNAIDEVFYYYNFPKVEIPANITEPLQQIEYAANTVGMMKATLKLKDGWYTDCLGPIIAFTKEGNIPVALFPKGFAQYYYHDPSTGKKVNLGKKTASQFTDEAVGFYEPLALKKLGISDLIAFMSKRLNHMDVVAFMIAGVAGGVISMVLPFIAQYMTGEILNMQRYGLFFLGASSIVVIVFLNWLFSSLSGAVTQRVKWKVTIPVEQAVIQRILTLPVPFFRQYSAGELTNRASSINSMCEIIINDVFSLSLSAVVSLMYLFSITKFAAKLAMPAMAIILLTVVLAVVSTVVQTRVTKRRMELLAQEDGLSYSILNGIQKIKLAGAEKRIFAKWAEHYAEGAALAYNPPFFLKINAVLVAGISTIGTVVFYAIAIMSGMKVSEYYAFNIAYVAMFTAFSQLANSSLSIAKIKPALDMAKPILNEEPEKTIKKDLVTKLNGSIELNGVYFRYNEQAPYILENFNLKVKAGEYVAIVGKTGCGKSTLVRLILGFEKPEKGIVFFDGKDIERIDLKSLRRRIGSVIQDAKLFLGDIRENISIASEKLTEEEVWEAAEMAGIADDIRDMPMGMNTIISEGQGGISGGQRQRLLIARAVASKPKILIFDEATSALDNITQKQISEALDGLKCTRIVIAHRLSTIKNCDRILVLDGGKIVEQGKYQELIDKKGIFYELVERQQL
ncbi:MAG: ATP-binding cassette domain-containing protein [Butyrivibrio sp.]|nr:ATP-binding cassette domain-containing protein [Butyrivibrio sp.]